MIHTARRAPGLRFLLALVCLVPLVIGSCGPSEGGSGVSYFRFVMDGVEYEVEDAELSVLPLSDDERHHYMISSSMDGPSRNQSMSSSTMPAISAARLVRPDTPSRFIRSATAVSRSGRR